MSSRISDCFCITDIGSTTTKAILFRKSNAGWEYLREEAPTTVEKPHEDVTVGVSRALERLEKRAGEKLVDSGRPNVPYLSTSSAGGGLAMVVTGLVSEITADTADKVALGAGAIVLDVIALNDGRTNYRKIEDLRRERPDMVLLAGGFDGEAIGAPVFLAEIIVESDLHPKLNPDANLPVVYAGNVNATEYVRLALGDEFMFHPVENIRPQEDRENPEPARKAIHSLFMDHVMSQAPGYERLKPWVAAPIRPTPGSVAGLLSLLSRKIEGTVMAIDIGGATTDVFTAQRGKVIRTVSANLGMSYSILNVAELGGVKPILDLIDSGLSSSDLWNEIANKHIDPTALPTTEEELKLEWATATVAIREAVADHLEVLEATEEEVFQIFDISSMLRKPRRLPDLHTHVSLLDYDVIIGSGGILSHSPRSAAAMMLIDAVQPRGQVEIAVDSAFMFPHLGMIAEMDEELALELLHDIGLVRLGTLIAPRDGTTKIKLTWQDSGQSGKTINELVDVGEFRTFELPAEAPVSIEYIDQEDDERNATRLTLNESLFGLIVDNRVRPVEGRANVLMPAEYRTPERSGEPETGAGIWKGRLELRRELAIPGDVFVEAGEEVDTDTTVARSVREFLRPFFLNVQEALGVPGEDVPKYLQKKVGDEVKTYDVIALGPKHYGFHKRYRSPVDGRVEKILPSGTLVVREKPERARVYTSVEAAKILRIEPARLKPYLRVEVGQEVERGQWLAAIMDGATFKKVESPVRGKVNRIDPHFGIILIEPLLEEVEVRAWLPGKVIEVTEKGCVIANEATMIEGTWGRGGEAAGKISIEEPQPGSIVVTQHATSDLIENIHQTGAGGLVAGGLEMEDFLDPQPGFTVVMTGRFGDEEMDPEIFALLQSWEGKQALLDGTTQLRVGVVRPRIILPNG
jgi:uncharacterized protein (TIGR01319 family)